MANRFSRKFLKHCGFTETAISLGSDKLKQVRIRFASHAILIRKAIANDDLILLSKFNEVLRKLCLEKDKDVSDVSKGKEKGKSEWEGGGSGIVKKSIKKINTRSYFILN